jgi:hypothetical protein
MQGRCRAPYQKCLYGAVVVGLKRSNDTKSYPDGSTVTGGVSHAGRSRVMTQTKRDTPVLEFAGWT